MRATTGGPWAKDSAVTVSFELEGQGYIAFNGGPEHPFTDAFSLSVGCATQDEIDYYWSELTAGGGQEIECGWLKDKFGLCWQIVPDNIGELIKSPEAMQALMGMTKLDKLALEAAAKQ